MQQNKRHMERRAMETTLFYNPYQRLEFREKVERWLEE